MRYTITNHYINIKQYWETPRADIPYFVSMMFLSYQDKAVIAKRWQWGVRLEWYAQNFLFKYGFAKDTELQITAKPRWYYLLGVVGVLFIK